MMGIMGNISKSISRIIFSRIKITELPQFCLIFGTQTDTIALFIVKSLSMRSLDTPVQTVI